jgi:pimeloyl-ACP methyl ester carboxylesterase
VQFRGHQLANRIAAETRLCLFDHAGQGGSDPPPNEPRSADDLTDDIHDLLEAAGVNRDLVLVGSSFGGFTMAYYAQRFPDLVSGVVTLDTPAPSDELNLQNFPEGVWDAPGNIEHLEVLFGFENRFAKDPLKVAAPLIVIRATRGQTLAGDHYWLENNPQAVEVNLVGGHEIYADQPEAVAEQVLSLVD